MAKVDCRDCNEAELRAWIKEIIAEHRQRIEELNMRYRQRRVDPFSYEHYLGQAWDSIEYWENQLAKVGQKEAGNG